MPTNALRPHGRRVALIGAFALLVSGALVPGVASAASDPGRYVVQPPDYTQEHQMREGLLYGPLDKDPTDGVARN